MTHSFEHFTGEGVGKYLKNGAMTINQHNLPAYKLKLKIPECFTPKGDIGLLRNANAYMLAELLNRLFDFNILHKIQSENIEFER